MSTMVLDRDSPSYRLGRALGLLEGILDELGPDDDGRGRISAFAERRIREFVAEETVRVQTALARWTEAAR